MSSASSIRVAGSLLPPEVLAAMLSGGLEGLTPADYHLAVENPREAAARVWTHLLGVYRRFRDEIDRRPTTDPAIGLTRERWLTQLLSALDYGRVPATPAGGLDVEGKTYPISHLWGVSPIHLLGWNVPLDTRSPGVAGAAQRAPHAMVQEALNRTDTMLWAIVSNGRVLRLLRDSTTLTGQAYVEFDLEAMFDAELFADFTQLYLLVHQSRVEIPDGQSPRDCWLERWRTTAINQGVRALTLLRGGVQQALETLGSGFLQHPANTELRGRLDAGEITLTDLHQSLLRVVYRLLFWFVAEDRDALLDPNAEPTARTRYQQHFSSDRLRRLARHRYGSAHHDLWDCAGLVLGALGRQDGEPRLGIPGLGGLFSNTEADVLDGARLGNQPLLAAIRGLSIVQPKGQPRRTVDFRHLGAEELGSIYESLLELIPRRDPISHTFTLEDAAGNDRKTSGSYYTPTELVELVLDTALDPVLDDIEKNAAMSVAPGTTRTGTEPSPSGADAKTVSAANSALAEVETALLNVTVCDPACGSGHFLVAAARRIATRLATARTGEIDPTPTMFTEAMHDVVARCIYGVDINPMAADLAKVSLWLEAMTPGKPLSFLDHHIKVGNALLGTTPKLLHDGIPDGAYVALTGDDKKVATTWKNLNIRQRDNNLDLFTGAGVEVSNLYERKAIDEISDTVAQAQSLADVAWAAQRYATMQMDGVVVRNRRVADAWCAAFLAPKVKNAEPITQVTLDQIASGDAPEATTQLIDSIAAQHKLFHWHLEFPDIFQVPDGGVANTPTGWSGGVTCMLGNPPWEILQMSEKEFFASREPSIALAPTAAIRKRMIAELKTTKPSLMDEFSSESRRFEAENQLIRGGRFPLCARGKINTYSIFAEHFRSSLAPEGRSGIITPTGLATDATTAAFFADTLRAERLVAFFDFVTSAQIWSGIGHNRFRFAVSCMTGGARSRRLKLAFESRHPSELEHVDAIFSLTSAEVLKLNPNTGTLPIFRTRRDAEITLACYHKHSVLIRDGDPDGNPWALRFRQGLFNMTSDSAEFRTANDLETIGARFDGWAWRHGSDRWLPLHEAKLYYFYDHRLSTYAGLPDGFQGSSLPRLSDSEHNDPDLEPLAKHWIDSKSVAAALSDIWQHDWLLSWRDITNATNERTFITSALPSSAVGNNAPIAIPADVRFGALLQAVWSSFVFDYVARQKTSGSHLNFYTVSQLSCPTPLIFDERPDWSESTLDQFVRLRVLELAYTSYRMRPYADDVMPGAEPGEPFRWLPERRTQLMSELDAAMLHVYGLNRDDAEHVLDSFTVLRKYDERDYGEFRTKRLVLAEYDAMARAAAANPNPASRPILTGELQTPADQPLPADDPRAGQPPWPYRSPLTPPPGSGSRHPPRPS